MLGRADRPDPDELAVGQLRDIQRPVRQGPLAPSAPQSCKTPLAMTAVSATRPLSRFSCWARESSGPAGG
jgi:hypothetical protein